MGSVSGSLHHPCLYTGSLRYLEHQGLLGCLAAMSEGWVDESSHWPPLTEARFRRQGAV